MASVYIQQKLTPILTHIVTDRCKPFHHWFYYQDDIMAFTSCCRFTNTLFFVNKKNILIFVFLKV